MKLSHILTESITAEVLHEIGFGRKPKPEVKRKGAHSEEPIVKRITSVAANLAADNRIDYERAIEIFRNRSQQMVGNNDMDYYIKIFNNQWDKQGREGPKVQQRPKPKERPRTGKAVFTLPDDPDSRGKPIEFK